MERTMHRLTIHITDNDKFDKFVELDGLQPYAEALHNAMRDRDISLYRNNRLLFIAKENNPLNFGTIYRICGAIQILFGDGLVWDIVEDADEQADALLLLNYKQ
ncbi:hypothetical protein [uncultured Alistipes sp.]|uniref:hypothetical protein n=1 Tax=uncultured Alistipes sp. TaxID=538949 RepID=UPI0025EB07D6|nr:hypothetical protein [uncultured Alistipes sp.]